MQQYKFNKKDIESLAFAIRLAKQKIHPGPNPGLINYFFIQASVNQICGIELNSIAIDGILKLILQIIFEERVSVFDQDQVASISQKKSQTIQKYLSSAHKIHASTKVIRKIINIFINNFSFYQQDKNYEVTKSCIWSTEEYHHKKDRISALIKRNITTEEMNIIGSTWFYYNSYKQELQSPSDNSAGNSRTKIKIDEQRDFLEQEILQLQSSIHSLEKHILNIKSTDKKTRPNIDGYEKNLAQKKEWLTFYTSELDKLSFKKGKTLSKTQLEKHTYFSILFICTIMGLPLTSERIEISTRMEFLNVFCQLPQDDYLKKPSNDKLSQRYRSFRAFIQEDNDRILYIQHCINKYENSNYAPHLLESMVNEFRSKFLIPLEINLLA